MSNVLILVGSPRSEGNTMLLAQSVARGASQHHLVDILSVADLSVGPCRACNACFSNSDNHCVQLDDMPSLYQRLMAVDVLVLASPVYFYGISAQLKAIVDRLHNPIRDRFTVKKCALVLVGGSSRPQIFDSSLLRFQQLVAHFNLSDAGHLLVGGMRNAGDVRDTHFISEAYALGQSL